MNLIKPRVVIESDIDGDKILKHIEKAGRTCYKSEASITSDSAKMFVKSIINRGHESVLEHISLSVRFIIDRGVSHELVRHRLASFSQESTRYVNYNKKGIEFILPPWVTDIPLGEYSLSNMKINGVNVFGTYPKEYEKRLTTLPEIDKHQVIWLMALLESENYYNILINSGWRPEQARSVLPNALKTEIVTTCNLREWRHILKLRTSKAAHPQIREVMVVLLKKFKKTIPIVFDEIQEIK
jgi:thymidylate synthase (FAD)